MRRWTVVLRGMGGLRRLGFEGGGDDGAAAVWELLGTRTRVGAFEETAFVAEL